MSQFPVFGGPLDGETVTSNGYVPPTMRYPAYVSHSSTIYVSTGHEWKEIPTQRHYIWHLQDKHVLTQQGKDVARDKMVRAYVFAGVQ